MRQAWPSQCSIRGRPPMPPPLRRSVPPTAQASAAERATTPETTPDRKPPCAHELTRRHAAAAALGEYIVERPRVAADVGEREASPCRTVARGRATAIVAASEAAAARRYSERHGTSMTVAYRIPSHAKHHIAATRQGFVSFASCAVARAVLRSKVWRALSPSPGVRAARKERSARTNYYLALSPTRGEASLCPRARITQTDVETNKTMGAKNV